MDTDQNNASGDSVINLQAIARLLNDDSRNRILGALERLRANSVTFQYEYSDEARDFVSDLADFLRDSGYNVYGENDQRIMSGIAKGEFSVARHPTDPTFAIIKIGALF